MATENGNKAEEEKEEVSIKSVEDFVIDKIKVLKGNFYGTLQESNSDSILTYLMSINLSKVQEYYLTADNRLLNDLLSPYGKQDLTAFLNDYDENLRKDLDGKKNKL